MNTVKSSSKEEKSFSTKVKRICTLLLKGCFTSLVFVPMYLLVISGHQVVVSLFLISLAISVGFICVCYLAPVHWLRESMSQSFTFRAENMIGRKGFEIQIITYLVNHDKWFNVCSHYCFILSPLVWFIVALSYGNIVGIIFLMLLFVQSISFKDVVLTPILIILYVLIFLLAKYFLYQFGTISTDLAMSYIMSNAFFTFITHCFDIGSKGFGHASKTTEPSELGFVELQTTFSSLKKSTGCLFSKRMVFMMFLGTFLEFTTSIPFKFFPVFTQIILEYFGYKSKGLIHYDAAKAIASKVRCEGWQSYLKANKMPFEMEI